MKKPSPATELRDLKADNKLKDSRHVEHVDRLCSRINNLEHRLEIETAKRLALEEAMVTVREVAQALGAKK